MVLVRLAITAVVLLLVAALGVIVLAVGPFGLLGALKMRAIDQLRKDSHDSWRKNDRSSS